MEASVRTRIVRLVGASALFASFPAVAQMSTPSSFKASDPSTIRGAVYYPAKAYNGYQVLNDWINSDTRADTELTWRHDFQIAKDMHRNALRVFVNYDLWRLNRTGFKQALDQMIRIAAVYDQHLYISLFQNNGVPFTLDAAERTVDGEGMAIGNVLQAPSRAVTDKNHPERWDAAGDRQSAGAFVRWIIRNYANPGNTEAGRDDVHSNLLAIEVMNEPGVGNRDTADDTRPFAAAMMKVARSERDKVGGRAFLMIGTNNLEDIKFVVDAGADMDVYTVHDNFPDQAKVKPGGGGASDYSQAIKDVRAYADQQENKPGVTHPIQVWLTEWQRAQGGTTPDPQNLPAYRTLAPTVLALDDVPGFFWSLMIKPAALQGFRNKGIANGLFWPRETETSADINGLVESLKDLKAIDPYARPSFPAVKQIHCNMAEYPDYTPGGCNDGSSAVDD